MYEGLMLFTLYIFLAWLNVRGEKLVWGILGIVVPLFAWLQNYWPLEFAVFLLLVSFVLLGVKFRGGV